MAKKQPTRKTNTTKAKTTKVNEPDIEDASVIDDYISDPLNDTPTVERGYSSPKIDSSAFSDIPDIEEPEIADQGYDFDSDNSGEPDIDSVGGGDPEPTRPRFEPGPTSFPGMEEADSKTKKQGATYMAETILLAYEQLHELGGKLGKTDMDKLGMKALRGEFDMNLLNVQLPMSEDDPSQTISVIDFLDQINEQLDDVLVVDEEFKERARPLLIKVLQKKGWGMTPEQQLMIMFAEDAIPKIITLFAIKANTRQILDLGMNLYKQRASGVPNFGNATNPGFNENVSEQKPPEPEKKTKPKKEKASKLDDNEMEEETPKAKKAQVVKQKKTEKTLNHVNLILGSDSDVKEPEE